MFDPDVQSLVVSPSSAGGEPQPHPDASPSRRHGARAVNMMAVLNAEKLRAASAVLPPPSITDVFANSLVPRPVGSDGTRRCAAAARHKCAASPAPIYRPPSSSPLTPSLVPHPSASCLWERSQTCAKLVWSCVMSRGRWDGARVWRRGRDTVHELRCFSFSLSSPSSTTSVFRFSPPPPFSSFW